MPHITVTIPVYNRAHLVGRTIESVLGQQLQDLDVLVVDDASKDDSVEVVRQYSEQDSRLRLVVNLENLGLTRNWNQCLELARGPLVQIVQSDDLIDPGYLDMVSRVFSECPTLGFVAASCRYVDPDDRVIHPGRPKAPCLYRAGDQAVTAMLDSGWPHVSSVVFWRECYERLGGFNERIWHGPDGEMFTRMASKYDYFHFGGIHTSFRRHGSNLGVLEYLRDDFLEVDMYKRRLAWSYLSPGGQQRLGVKDLDEYITQSGARSALTGATLMVAYGRADLGRSYIAQALRLDSQAWQQRQFWKALALNAVPIIGKPIMEGRLGMRAMDHLIAREVETCLNALGA